MQVLLIDNFPSLGYVGDTVQVKNGYARNYLIPRGIAVEVGSRRAKVVQHLQQGVQAKRARLKTEAESLGEKIAGEKIEFTLKIGTQGKSFGSISNRDVLQKLNELGYELERKQIRLSEAIKSPGNYNVTVQLHSDVSIELPIEVIGLKEKPKAEEGKKKGKGAKAKRDASPEEEELAADEAEVLEEMAEGDSESGESSAEESSSGEESTEDEQ